MQFDVPRHRLFMGFREDWPRMNAVPEWFTVEPEEAHRYKIVDADSGEVQVVSGKLLSEGMPVHVDTEKPLRLAVVPITVAEAAPMPAAGACLKGGLLW